MKNSIQFHVSESTVRSIEEIKFNNGSERLVAVTKEMLYKEIFKQVLSPIK